MCGITGIFSYSGDQKAWLDSDLDLAIGRIRHRGPDDSGKYVEPGLFLGHTRLAVLDLSPAGHQPMFSSDKRYVISFNGEIYNFKEIRSRLINDGYKFVSNSDTEVLVNAWSRWQEACLDKFDGIFAFAVFDRKKKELFLVRDHLGVKPLFYASNKEGIFFASELLALFGPLNPYPAINSEDLDVYFTFNYLPAPRTGLKGAHQLAPGSLLKVSRNGAILRRYWQPEYKRQPEAPIRARECFEGLLFDAVNSQMVSDAPLGVFLSGGLDSYAIASSAVLTGSRPDSFTLGFDEPKFDESLDAAGYARHLGIGNTNKRFSFNEQEVRQTLSAMSELLADASCFPVFQLSHFARSQVTVALSGDGGDELLCGYDTYRAGNVTPYFHMLPGQARMLLRKAVWNLLPNEGRYSWRMVAGRFLDAANEPKGRDHVSFRRIFSDQNKKRLYCPDFYQEVQKNDPVGEYAALIKEVPQTRSYLTARQHADLAFHLPSILAKVDRMSMANSLEVRVPFLSKQMVDFCLNLPDNAKTGPVKGKQILRHALKGKIPVSGLKRPKAGFIPAVDRWFRMPGSIYNVFGDYLAQARSSGLGYLNWGEVEKLWEEHKQGREEAGFVLLGVLQFINWGLKCR